MDRYWPPSPGLGIGSLLRQLEPDVGEAQGSCGGTVASDRFGILRLRLEEIYLRDTCCNGMNSVRVGRATIGFGMVF